MTLIRHLTIDINGCWYKRVSAMDCPGCKNRLACWQLGLAWVPWSPLATNQRNYQMIRHRGRGFNFSTPSVQYRSRITSLVVISSCKSIIRYQLCHSCHSQCSSEMTKGDRKKEETHLCNRKSVWVRILSKNVTRLSHERHNPSKWFFFFLLSHLLLFCPPVFFAM